MKKLLASLPIIIVFVATLSLLAYIGRAEAHRRYPSFQWDKLIAQAQVIQQPITQFLNAGLPLHQFSAFSSMSRSLLNSDPTIRALALEDPRKKRLFEEGHTEETKGVVFSAAATEARESLDFKESKGLYRLEVPIDSKFGRAGSLVLYADRKASLSYLNQRYRWVFFLLVGLSLGLSVFVLVQERREVTGEQRKKSYKRVYFACFIAFSAAIALIAGDIYSHGARARLEATSAAMAERFSAIYELGLSVEDVTGINRTFADFLETNPDVSAISMVRGERVIFDAAPERIGRRYVEPRGSFSQSAKIAGAPGEITVAVSLPMEVVTGPVFASVRAFIVLLVACGLIAIVFLDTGTALSEVTRKALADAFGSGGSHTAVGKEDFRVGLNLVRPAYFLVIFMNCLSIAFLPQLVTELAEKTGSSLATASFPFSMYYFMFAAVMVPAGRYAERGHLKRLMCIGCVAEFIGVTLIATTDDYWSMVVARSSSGVGQGLFLIGLQSYLLAITPKDMRTQGHAIKVIGKNAGSIAGSAIGALLVAYINYHYVFMLASLIAMVNMFYVHKIVPGVDRIGRKQTTVVPKGGRRAGLQNVFKDGEFMKTLILVGYFSKMTITGVVMFATPLMFSRIGFSTESIGQALMIYYICSMVMTFFISRWVDRLGSTKSILVLSAFVGGVGIMLLGILSVPDSLPDAGGALIQAGASCKAFLSSLGGVGLVEAALVISLAVVGLSFGLSAAPLLTHVTKTEVAAAEGNKAVSATYVFLERGGHILGPIVVSQLFWFFHQSIAIAIFGAAMLLLGLFFMFASRVR